MTAVCEPSIVDVLADARPVALRVALRLTRSMPDAEDLVHDAMAKCLARADRIDDASTARAYLLMAVRNTAKNNWRRRDQQRRRVGDHVEYHDYEAAPSTADGPEDRAEISETLAEVRAVWDRLTEQEQLTIRQRYVEGLSYEEMVEIQGRTAVAIRQCAHRARERLAHLYVGAARRDPSLLALLPTGVPIEGIDPRPVYGPPEPPTPGTRVDPCVECGELFTQERRRGRPRARCEGCR